MDNDQNFDYINEDNTLFAYIFHEDEDNQEACIAQYLETQHDDAPNIANSINVLNALPLSNQNRMLDMDIYLSEACYSLLDKEALYSKVLPVYRELGKCKFKNDSIKYKYTCLTIQLLSSPPGKERDALLTEYKKCALELRDSTSPWLIGLGLAMMILCEALLITALVTSVLVPITIPTLALGAVLGGVLFTAGAYRFFSKNSNAALKHQCGNKMLDLENHIANSEEENSLPSSIETERDLPRYIGSIVPGFLPNR